MKPQSAEKSRRTLVLIMRILLWLVWAGLLLGAFSFACVMALIFANPRPQPPGQPPDIAVLMVVDLLVGVPVLALVHGVRFAVLRLLVQRGAWRGTAIAYPIFKLVSWGAANGVLFFSLVICLIARSFWPGLTVAIPAWLLIAVDFPLLYPFTRLARAGEGGAA